MYFFFENDTATTEIYKAKTGGRVSGVEETGATFPGRGQGRSPRRTAADLRRGWFTMLPPGDPLTERFVARLQALPDQERPRPDPVFSLRAFRKPTAG